MKEKLFLIENVIVGGGDDVLHGLFLTVTIGTFNNLV